MDSVNASYFKTHFGEILGRSSRSPVRITRRGYGSAVLISEEAFQQLKQKAMRLSEAETSALDRLKLLAATAPNFPTAFEPDDRLRAICEKHAPEIMTG